MVQFFLGSHQPAWLERTDVPLFLSHRRLSGRTTLPRARGPWALDSGGYSELKDHGEWLTQPGPYAAAARRYYDEIGGMQFLAPQDWMCEPWIVAKTGLSVAEHQRRTIASVLDLHELAPELPWAPVLQGWQHDDYLRHVDAYGAAGVDLWRSPVVLVGSVCRRQATGMAERLMAHLAGLGLKLHGLGFKLGGLAKAAHSLTSADSMAWSFTGRRQSRVWCGSTTHKNEANCFLWAMHWRERVLALLGIPQQMPLEWAA